MDIVIRKYQQDDKRELIKFMEELQDFLVEKDPLKRMRRLPEYGNKYVEGLLQKVENNDGVILIAETENEKVGCIVGLIEMQSENDLFGYVPTKAGRIIELIVSDRCRGKKIGSLLMDSIEEYFKQKRCNLIRVAVFEPNIEAHEFYQKQSYSERVIDMVKVI